MIQNQPKHTNENDFKPAENLIYTKRTPLRNAPQCGILIKMDFVPHLQFAVPTRQRKMESGSVENLELEQAAKRVEELRAVIEKNNHNVEDYEMKTILTKLGLHDFDKQIDVLSGGQRKRLALACALLTKCDLLLLDEPTNHLDNGMIEYLEKFLIKWSKGLLMVTHDRYFLERVVNRIIEIDHGQIYKYEANYSKYLELKQVRLETQLSSQRKRKLFLKKELEWVRAGVQARTTKSKDRLQRFEGF